MDKNQGMVPVKTPLDAKTETLLRQVKAKVELEGKGTKNSAAVSFGKLLSCATGWEKFKLVLGWVFAVVTGCVLPVFFFLLGPIFDSFGQGKTAEETREAVEKLCLIMLLFAIGIMFSSILQNYLLLSTQASVAARLRTNYLRAVLNQESAWYDQTNFLELPSRLNQEVDMIQSGIGQKFGSILYAVSMSVSGLICGFYKGWLLAFAILGIAPILLIGMGIFAAIMEKNTVIVMKAYGQSAGYAEQALAAIRIVVSCGTETLEVSNFNQYLERVRTTSIKQGVSVGLSLGFFFFCIYLCYAYAFFIGSIFVDKEIWNGAEGRPYLAGDCIAVFFGVLIGLFSLGGAGPAITSVNMAKAAGKTAFDVMDRKPTILQDDPSAAKHALQG